MKDAGVDKDAVSLVKGDGAAVGLIYDASSGNIAEFKFVMPVPGNIRLENMAVPGGIQSIMKHLAFIGDGFL